MKEKMISSGKELYKQFNQFRSTKMTNSAVKLNRFARFSTEDLPWAELNTMEPESLIPKLELEQEADILERCSSWASNIKNPFEAVNLSEEPKEDIQHTEDKNQIENSPAPLLMEPTMEMEVVKSRAVEEDTQEDIPMEVVEQKTISENTGFAILPITEETIHHYFVNLVEIHDLLHTYSASQCYKPLHPLLNHLRRRLLAILRFCYNAESGDMVLSNLNNDETWPCKEFSKNSVFAAISDVKWASSSNFFKQYKMQIQLDLAAGPYAIFEEILAVQTMSKMYRVHAE